MFVYKTHCSELWKAEVTYIWCLAPCLAGQLLNNWQPSLLFSVHHLKRLHALEGEATRAAATLLAL